MPNYEDDIVHELRAKLKKQQDDLIDLFAHWVYQGHLASAASASAKTLKEQRDRRLMAQGYLSRALDLRNKMNLPVKSPGDIAWRQNYESEGDYRRRLGSPPGTTSSCPDIARRTPPGTPCTAGCGICKGTGKVDA